jgi:DNA-binding transcriptional ArsR family regulator
MLRRISLSSMSVGEMAAYYPISFAGVAKHLSVLEGAGLISKSRNGKEQIVSIEPRALEVADGFFEPYRKMWEQRLDNLEKVLKANKKKGKKHGAAGS